MHLTQRAARALEFSADFFRRVFRAAGKVRRERAESLI